MAVMAYQALLKLQFDLDLCKGGPGDEDGRRPSLDWTGLSSIFCEVASYY